MTTRPHAQKGFTLLLAALVAAIVLALGSSIYSIAKKQVTLSSLGRDSQFAFYAADTAAECALYYDVRFSADPTRSFATSTPASPWDITCDQATAQVTAVQTPSGVESTFTLTLFTKDENGNAQAGNCAIVTVSKNTVSPYTIIHSDGFSTPCATITTSARALQRTIEIQY